jgi:long-chain fatty acid transport protein
MRKHTAAKLILGGGLTALAQPALAGAYYLQDQSTRGAGRAYSGEIADTGADSLWWNPAAIGGMTGGDASLNATAILPRATVTDTGTLIARPGTTYTSVGGNPTTYNPVDSGVVPSGAIAHALTNQIALGLAITAPYNFTTKYSTDSFARYDALATRLRSFDIQPGAAVHFDAGTIGINLGAAVNVERTIANFGTALPNVSSLQSDGQEQLYGKGWDVGYSLGARVTDGPLSVGLMYKSSIAHHLKGNVAVTGLQFPLSGNNFSEAAEARFATPWQLGLGARYQLTRRLTLDAQVIRIGWSRFDQIELGAPLNTQIPETYRNTWNYALGLDADLGHGWTVRTGVQRDLSPVLDDARDARVPDSDRWIFAAGASHEIVKNLTIDAAANYITLADAAINRPTEAYAGTIVATPVVMSGEMTGAHVVVLSLGGRLKF